MRAVFTDLHIHTSENSDTVNEEYNSKLLVQKVKEFCQYDYVLLSLTDHNTSFGELTIKPVNVRIE